MNIKQTAIYDHVISTYTYTQLFDITCHGFFEVAYNIDHPYDMSYYLDLNRFYSDYCDDIWALLKDASEFFGYRSNDSLAIAKLLSESKNGFVDHNGFIKAIVWTAIEHLANQICDDIDRHCPRSFSKWLRDNESILSDKLTLSEVDLDQAKNGIYVIKDLTNNDHSEFDDYQWLSDSQYAIMARYGGDSDD